MVTSEMIFRSIGTITNVYSIQVLFKCARTKRPKRGHILHVYTENDRAKHMGSNAGTGHIEDVNESETTII